MPYKHNTAGRHHIPKARYKVTNWAEYERGLVQRGSLQVWMSDDALASWEPPKRKTRGGQASYTDLAIETCLTLGCVYNLPLRQTEGFVRSILGLLGRSDLASPDHSTLVRRRRTTPVALNAEGRNAPVVLVIDSTGLKFYGPGEWDRFKHGEKRRAWRKLHIAADAGTGEILSFELTDSDTSDGAMAGQLVAEAGGSVAKVICDGAYDGDPVYDAIRAARPARSPPKIVIPPPKPSIPEKGAAHDGSERSRHAAHIAEKGRIAWQKDTGYGARSHAETTIGRLKGRHGGQLTARSFGSQKREVAYRIAVSNKEINLARPVSIRVA